MLSRSMGDFFNQVPRVASPWVINDDESVQGSEDWEAGGANAEYDVMMMMNLTHAGAGAYHHLPQQNVSLILHNTKR